MYPSVTWLEQARGGGWRLEPGDHVGAVNRAHRCTIVRSRHMIPSVGGSRSRATRPGGNAFDELREITSPADGSAIQAGAIIEARNPTNSPVEYVVCQTLERLLRSGSSPIVTTWIPC
jgi:hypothetical protein